MPLVQIDDDRAIFVRDPSLARRIAGEEADVVDVVAPARPPRPRRVVVTRPEPGSVDELPLPVAAGGSGFEGLLERQERRRRRPFDQLAA